MLSKYLLINLIQLLIMNKARVIIKSFVQIFAFTLLLSCSGWTEKDKVKYIIECQRAKLDSTFCQCSLEKITSKYSSFEEAMYNEQDFLEIFQDCKN